MHEKRVTMPNIVCAIFTHSDRSFPMQFGLGDPATRVGVPVYVEVQQGASSRDAARILREIADEIDRRGDAIESVTEFSRPFKQANGEIVMTNADGDYITEHGNLGNVQADEAEDQRAWKRKRAGLTYWGMEDECTAEEIAKRRKATAELPDDSVFGK